MYGKAGRRFRARLFKLRQADEKYDKRAQLFAPSYLLVARDCCMCLVNFIMCIHRLLNVREYFYYFCVS